MSNAPKGTYTQVLLASYIRRIGNENQHIIAATLGVTQQCVHRWLAGKGHIGYENAMRIALAIGLNPEPVLKRLIREAAGRAKAARAETKRKQVELALSKLDVPPPAR